MGPTPDSLNPLCIAQICILRRNTDVIISVCLLQSAKTLEIGGIYIVQYVRALWISLLNTILMCSSLN